MQEMVNNHAKSKHVIVLSLVTRSFTQNQTNQTINSDNFKAK